MELGVNIDHVATLRNARGGIFPSPVHAAFVALEAGAFNITCHLREDRRHIKDEDVRLISSLTKKLNLEMAAEDDIIKIALEIMPRSVTFVPERRQELTTEGGLNVLNDIKRYEEINKEFKSKNITVSAFIEPDLKQVEASKKGGFDFIEIHTGSYADKIRLKEKSAELERIKTAIDFASKIELKVNAGHGLDYKNIYSVALLDGIFEFNIGFSIISHSLFVGLGDAVKEMLKIIKSAEFSKLKDAASKNTYGD